MKNNINIFNSIFCFEFTLAENKDLTIYEGNVDAKVVIKIYESLTCGHCADFHKKVYPKLKKILLIQV